MTKGAKLLGEGNYLKLFRTHDGYEYVDAPKFFVAVLPYRYTTHEALQVLARLEPQPQFEVKHFLTCITGEPDFPDETAIDASARELYEEAGIEDGIFPYRDFRCLGRINQSKVSALSYALHTIDLSHMTFEDTKLVGPGDGSKWEKDACCMWMSHYHVKETCHCSVMLSALSKLEHYLEKIKLEKEQNDH